MNPKEWQEYCKAAATTESIPKLQLVQDDVQNMRAIRFLHAVIGLETETSELISFTDDKNIVEELGDCFWYLAILQNTSFNVYPYFRSIEGLITETTRENFEANVQVMRHNASELIDIVAKRHIYYGRDLDNMRFVEAVDKFCDGLVCAVYASNNLLTHCLDANIKKLAKRYPDGRFDGFHAVHRNVENELSHISDPAQIEDKELDKETFWHIMETEIAYADQAPTIASWALTLSNIARQDSRHAMAEGYKAAYVEILSKPANLKEEAWKLLLSLAITNKPISVKEFREWLKQNGKL